MMDKKPVLVTEDTGYVGGRLVPLLLSNGHRIRVVVGPERFTPASRAESCRIGK